MLGVMLPPTLSGLANGDTGVGICDSPMLRLMGALPVPSLGLTILDETNPGRGLIWWLSLSPWLLYLEIKDWSLSVPSVAAFGGVSMEKHDATSKISFKLKKKKELK